MSRAHFAYPLVRSIDADGGGAADLQTDIMRFMAILALCLLAIFALVQSLPQPETLTSTAPDVRAEPIETAPPPETIVPAPATVLVRPAVPKPAPKEENVVLTRPKWQPPEPTRPAEPVAAARPPPAPAPASPPDESPGFTLRFESDLALSRLVATGQVGVFAVSGGSAQRMSVADSRISFWAAPVPRQYHEMDQATVPASVRNALERTGRRAPDTAWAVTLPARLSTKLARIMQEHRGGALVIQKDGTLRREGG